MNEREENTIARNKYNGLIVDGSSEFDFNMYMLDGVNDFSSCKASGIPARTHEKPMRND